MRISDWSSDVCSADLADLTERIGVSRQVLRQAVQMLEARGVLICRRGRSRGVEIRPDHAPGAIERIAQHCALLDMSEAEFRPILSMIGRLNRSLIGTRAERSEEHTSELQSLMRISYAVF